MAPSFIRVPYGATKKNVLDTLSLLKLKLILWDVDTLDWKFKNKDITYRYTLKKITGNNIILMHDSFKQSIDAATSLIDTLLSRGYIFVTISTFYNLKNNLI